MYSEKYPDIARTFGEIDAGLMILVGIAPDDTRAKVQAMAKKIVGLRFWPNAEGRPWSQNVVEAGYKILLVSQFTLFAQFKGTKPDFHGSMEPTAARELYYFFVEQVRMEYNALAAKVKGHPANDVVHLMQPVLSPPPPHQKKVKYPPGEEPEKFDYNNLETAYEAFIEENAADKTILHTPVSGIKGLELYDYNEYVQTTLFGSMMDVTLCNWGPVTIVYESPEPSVRKPKDAPAPAAKTEAVKEGGMKVTVEALPVQKKGEEAVNVDEVIKQIDPEVKPE